MRAVKMPVTPLEHLNISERKADKLMFPALSYGKVICIPGKKIWFEKISRIGQSISIFRPAYFPNVNPKVS